MSGSEVADWIAAIGQAVGAIGTFAAVAVALLIARRDGQRSEIDRREREAAQARLITARVDEDWHDIVDGTRSQLVIRNNSEHAIADLRVVEVDVEVSGRDICWVPEERATKGVDVVEPGSSATFKGMWECSEGTSSGDDYGGQGSDKGITAVDARVQFVDSSGVWWQRVANKDVVRSKNRPPREKLTWKEIEWVRTVPNTTEPEGKPPISSGRDQPSEEMIDVPPTTSQADAP